MGEKARRMIPCTAEVMSHMMASVMETMAEYGLIEIQEDAEATADHLMRVLEEQGMVVGGNVLLGRCVLLPHPDPGPGFSLLLVTSYLAEAYDPDLRPKSSPIRFDRTEEDRIIVPGRWLGAKLEELANNSAAPEGMRSLALNISRQSRIRDIELPREAETIAVTVVNQDGTKTIIEALPAGIVIFVDLETPGTARVHLTSGPVG